MDENTKDVVVLVGKRVLNKLKVDFKQFIECSPLYIALALSGLIWASWLGLVIVFILYLAFVAYQEYTDLEEEILFDEEIEKERKQHTEYLKENEPFRDSEEVKDPEQK